MHVLNKKRRTLSAVILMRLGEEGEEGEEEATQTCLCPPGAIPFIL